MPEVGIDPTIISKLAPPAIDPLAMVGKAQALQQSILQSRLTGQTLQSNVNSNAALSESIDPQTGLPVQGKVGQWFGDHPGALGAGDALSKAQTMQTAQIANQTAALQQKRTALGLSEDQGKTLAAVTLPFIMKFSTPGKDGKVPVPTDKDFADMLSTGITNMGAGVDPNLYPRVVNLIQHAGNDPDKILEAAKSAYLIGNPTPEGISTLNGPVEKTDTGPSVALTQTPTLGGPTVVRAQIDKGLSPSEANTPAYTRMDAQGVQHIVTKAEAAATPAGQTPTGIASGLPVGAEQAAAGNVQQSLALQQRAAIVPQRRAALHNMVDTLDSFSTGPLAGKAGALTGLAAQFGIKGFQADTAKAGQDEFNKLAAQIALDQWGALGGSGSNQQLETSVKANPNDAMSKLGIKNVAALLQGNEDAISSQYDAWQKYKAAHGPSSYDTFLTGWNKYYDPRVFQAQHMAPAAVNVMRSKMTKEERATFDRDKSVAQQAGWLGQ